METVWWRVRAVPVEVPRWFHRGNLALPLWHCGCRLGTADGHDLTSGFRRRLRNHTAMTMTPNSSKILSFLRKSPRSSDATPTPSRTPSGDIDIPAPGDVSFHPRKTISILGATEMSIAVFSEAASLASNIPYMGVVAAIIVQIIRIRSVRTVLFHFLDWVFIFIYFCFCVFVVMVRKSICIGRCGTMSCITLSRSSILSNTSANHVNAKVYATRRRSRIILLVL